jgi:hypothetical protein
MPAARTGTITTATATYGQRRRRAIPPERDRDRLVDFGELDPTSSGSSGETPTAETGTSVGSTADASPFESLIKAPLRAERRSDRVR